MECMKKLFFISCILTLMFTTGCDSNLDSAHTQGEDLITPCSVPQVPLDIVKEELVLVESEAELNHIFAGHTQKLPQINFRKSKLLLIHGSHIKQVKEITLDGFEKDETGNGYDMRVSVRTENIDKDCYWTAAYLVPRGFYTPICLFLNIHYRLQTLGGKWFYFRFFSV